MSYIIRMDKLYYFHTKHSWKITELQNYDLMIPSFRILFTLGCLENKSPETSASHAT